MSSPSTKFTSFFFIGEVSFRERAKSRANDYGVCSPGPFYFIFGSLCGCGPVSAFRVLWSRSRNFLTQMMTARWSVAGRRFTSLNVAIPGTGAEIFLPHDPFSLTFKNDTPLLTSEGMSGTSCKSKHLCANPRCLASSRGFRGRGCSLAIAEPERRIPVVWRCVTPLS